MLDTKARAIIKTRLDRLLELKHYGDCKRLKNCDNVWELKIAYGLEIFLFSCEESRMHIHICSPHGEAKFWIEPVVALADYSGYSNKEIKELAKVVEEHAKEIEKAWKKHFGQS